jgi:hypothetical protein
MTKRTQAREQDPGATPGPSPPGWMDTYPNLSFTRAELAAAMRSTYDELISFVSQPAFRAVYEELRALPPSQRPKFVNDVLVNRQELMRRGVDIPDGILVQTSAFGDRRPTLFAVKKFLPEKFHAAWENVNLTFDNEYADDAVSRDPGLAWRKPLPVSLQSQLIAEHAELDDYPDVGRSDPAWSQGLGKTYFTRDT